MVARTWSVMRIGLGLSAALWALCPGAAARTAVAASQCTRLAAQLRGSPARVAQDRRHPLHWLKPWVTFAAVQSVKKAALDAHVLAQLRAAMGSRSPQSLERLPAAGLMRVSAFGVRLFGYCASENWLAHAAYFKRGQGSVVDLIAHPSLESSPCPTRLGWRSLATVLGEPAVIESDALDASGADVQLRIQPWLGKRWGPSCAVAIRFTYRPKITGRSFCGASRAVCTAAGQIAPALDRRYQRYLIDTVTARTHPAGTRRIHFGTALSRHARALIARARRVATVQALAAASTAKPAGLAHLRLEYVEYFPLRLNGTAYLGAIAPIAHGDHVLFGMYRLPGPHSSRLVPVTVVRLRWQVARVRSIQVRNPTTPGHEQ